LPLYDEIGKGYDTTRRADPYIAERLAHLLNVERDGRYLDIACGTGNYTVALSAKGASFCGLDASKEMLYSARSKSTEINWTLGDVSQLPFKDNSFDGTSCILAIHHFDEINTSFREAFRVLSSGKFVIFTATPEQMQSYWLNEYFPVAMKNSMKRMPPLELMHESLKSAGFKQISTELYEVKDDLRDLFLYGGKHRPGLYLNPNVRRGMSTFAAVARQEEVSIGCKRLEANIKSGRIKQVMADYEKRARGKGDYLFVIASK